MVFTFFFKTQNLRNSISFSLLSVQSEIQSYKIELIENNNKLTDGFQEIAGGKIRSRVVQPDTLWLILDQQELNDKLRSIPNEHLTLYY